MVIKHATATITYISPHLKKSITKLSYTKIRLIRQQIYDTKLLTQTTTVNLRYLRFSKVGQLPMREGNDPSVPEVAEG